MAMKPTHDLMVKTGSYTDRDGNQKNRWLKIGSRFQRDDGSEAIKLDCLPTGLPEWTGWVSVYPIMPKGEQSGNGYGQSQPQPQPASQPASAWEDAGDDIPF